jgi:hypothetical protein
MTEDLMGYAEMIDTAMRGVVRETLKRVNEHGLPGDHHCYISFKTHFPGVDIAPYLKERYPDEMTIVLQHQFWNLRVQEDFFAITLSFNRTKEELIIPFDALSAFADPSLKFGLQFHHKDSEDSGQQSFEALLENASDDDAKEARSTTAKVITLDAFRNRPQDTTGA